MITWVEVVVQFIGICSLVAISIYQGRQIEKLEKQVRQKKELTRDCFIKLSGIESLAARINFVSELFDKDII